MSSSHPRIRRTAQNTQFSYCLNRRVHDVKTYPVLSPQGATIIIYGHENGLTLLWRGGCRLRSSQKADTRLSGKGRRNGAKAADDAVMILDSDDEGPTAPVAASGLIDKPEFEESAPDSDGSYPEIIQSLDLAMGAEVLHIAVLPLVPCAAEDAGPEILRDKMVFAISCSTSDVYVVTLPLTPPSHESKERPELRTNLLAANAGNRHWGETLAHLGGQGKRSDGLAMALVKHKAPSTTRSKSSERTRSSSVPAVTRVVVAAHSREASGTLQLWDVPIGTKSESPDRPLEPFQTEYMPSPPTGISFNPSQSTQLLVTASPHAVRIYDYSIPSLPPDDISEGPFPSQGSWLLSLYPPFARGSLTSIARKPIVAAAWIAHGRAILALLADGQWGIWDIDGAGPSSTESASSLFGKSGVGVRGAALTSFSASGQLEGTSPLRNPAARRSEGDFAPMTPHTRRDALASSFSGGVERLAAVRGGIEVVQLPALRSGSSADESAVLWLGGADYIVTVIPGVARFWDAQVRRSAGGGVNLFSGAQPSRMLRLSELNAGLMGERCCGVGTVARFPRRFSDEDGAQGSGEGLPIEVVIQAESRLVIVRESENAETAFASRFLTSRKRKLGPAPASEPASAIIVQQRPGKSAVVPFNLSVNKRGSLRAPRNDEETFDAAESIFAKSMQADLGPPAEPRFPEEVTMTQSMMGGFGFASMMDDAADATDDEEAANDRDVEAEVFDMMEGEVLDIMEIDRTLDRMDGDRDSGRKHVFFEEG